MVRLTNQTLMMINLTPDSSLNLEADNMTNDVPGGRGICRHVLGE